MFCFLRHWQLLAHFVIHKMLLSSSALGGVAFTTDIESQSENGPVLPSVVTVRAQVRLSKF